MSRHRAPWILAGLTILTQICWPLLSGSALAIATWLAVLLFFATSITHAWQTRGPDWAGRYAVVTICFGFLIELVGIHSGLPFGHYTYSPNLGPQLASVSLLVPFAWAMMTYPALVVAQTLSRQVTHPRLATIVIGAWALTSWDMFLDPQMVDAGYWRWTNPDPHLPGIDGIPFGNFVGWFISSLVLFIVLTAVLPDRSGSLAVPAVMWTWTWVGGIIAFAVFLGRPSVAAVAGVAMGLVTVPFLISLRRSA